MNNMPNPAAVTTAAGAQPMPVPVQSAAPASKKGNGRSIASFIFGLISVVFLPLGLIPGFLGFVLNLDARRCGSTHSLLSAGRVLSIIGMVVVPGLFLLCLIPLVLISLASLAMM